MLYRNKKNGRMIDVQSELHGDWELATAPAAVKKEPVKKQEAEKPAKKAQAAPEKTEKPGDGYVTIKPKTVKKDKK